MANRNSHGFSKSLLGNATQASRCHLMLMEASGRQQRQIDVQCQRDGFTLQIAVAYNFYSNY